MIAFENGSSLRTGSKNGSRLIRERRFEQPAIVFVAALPAPVRYRLMNAVDVNPHDIGKRAFAVYDSPRRVKNRHDGV
jgi:hypothetical protein